MRWSRWEGRCYRAHDPRWAWTPISGEGAALRGGRFNRPGVPALYLALTLEGMLLEMGHGLERRMEPLTICEYDVDVQDIVDLSTPTPELRAELGCAWMDDRSKGFTPPSWRIADELIAKGAAGILVPSFAHGAPPDMRNLVLWTWGDSLPHKVTVYDPSDRLPRDGLSWGTLSQPEPDQNA